MTGWADLHSDSSLAGLLYCTVMRFLTGTSDGLQVTEREKEVAQQIMSGSSFEAQLGHHMACHMRAKTKALNELEMRIEGAFGEVENASARLAEMQAERNEFEVTWNEKWDARHKIFTKRFIELRAQNGKLPNEVK